MPLPYFEVDVPICSTEAPDLRGWDRVPQLATERPTWPEPSEGPGRRLPIAREFGKWRCRLLACAGRISPCRPTSAE